jgi:hypothetical protein
MRVHPSQRIVAERAQRDDLVAGIETQGIVDLDRRDIGMAQQIARSPVVNLRGVVGFVAFCPCQSGSLLCKHEFIDID